MCMQRKTEKTCNRVESSELTKRKHSNNKFHDDAAWLGWGPAQPWLEYRQGPRLIPPPEPGQDLVREKVQQKRKKKKKTMMVPGWAGAGAPAWQWPRWLDRVYGWLDHAHGCFRALPGPAKLPRTPAQPRPGGQGESSAKKKTMMMMLPGWAGAPA